MDEAIVRAIRKVKAHYPGATFMVFGSRARGEERRDSDLDLCVVLPEPEENPFEFLYRIRRDLHREVELPLDVFLSDKARFSKRAKIPSTMEYVIGREGVAL